MGRYANITRAANSDLRVVGIDWPNQIEGQASEDFYELGKATDWGNRLPDGSPTNYYYDAAGAGSEEQANANRARDLNNMADGGLDGILTTWYPTELGVGVLTGTQLITTGEAAPPPRQIWQDGFGRYFNQAAVKSRLKFAPILQASWAAYVSAGVGTWANWPNFCAYFAELAKDTQHLRAPNGRPILFLFDSSSMNQHFWDDSGSHLEDLDEAFAAAGVPYTYFYNVTNNATLATELGNLTRAAMVSEPDPHDRRWLAGTTGYGPAGPNPGTGRRPWRDQLNTDVIFQLDSSSNFLRGGCLTPGCNGRARSAGSAVDCDRPTYAQWERHVDQQYQRAKVHRYRYRHNLIVLYHNGTERAEGDNMLLNAETAEGGYDTLGMYYECLKNTKAGALPSTFVDVVHARSVANENFSRIDGLVVTRTGTWTLTRPLVGAYCWEAMRCSAAGSITFTAPLGATGFELYGGLGTTDLPSAGTGNVTVDGGAPTLVDQSVGSGRHQLLFSVTGLNPAISHTLVYTWVSGTIEVDACLIAKSR